MDEDDFGGYEEYEPSPYNGDDLDGGAHDGDYEDELDHLAEGDEDEGYYGPTDEFFYADEDALENHVECYGDDLP